MKRRESYKIKKCEVCGKELATTREMVRSKFCKKCGKERLKIGKKATAKRWAEKNRDKINETHRKWAEKNKDKIKEYQRRVREKRQRLKNECKQ